MRIGYGRVSTRDHNSDGQHAALKAAGCERVFIDHASGTLASRPELDGRPGDELVVTKLDRLGRSLDHLMDLAGDLQRREVHLVMLDQGIDTSTAVRSRSVSLNARPGPPCSLASVAVSTWRAVLRLRCTARTSAGCPTRRDGMKDRPPHRQIATGGEHYLMQQPPGGWNPVWLTPATPSNDTKPPVASPGA